MNKECIDWVLEDNNIDEIYQITLGEKPSKKLWFQCILPTLDFEIEGGTWENPKWAWELHPWFKALNLTREECEDWLQNE